MNASVKDGNVFDKDQLIQIPDFLEGTIAHGVGLMSCTYCEVACETSAMLCGQCSGQSCSGQCSSAQCGSCQSCQSACQKSCQNCQTACEINVQLVAPSYYISDIGTNSVTVHVYHGVGYRKFRVYVRYKNGNTSVHDASLSKSSDFSYTVSGLYPSTDYVINIGYAVDMSVSGVAWCGSTEFTTNRPSISKWDWTSSNGAASAIQTRSAYNAAIGKGSTTNFSYLVWNDMVDKVVEIMSVAGTTWSNQFASLSATKMTAGDRALTATRFNSLRFNIGSHVSTGIYDVAKGDPVLGSYFITLTDRINKWIETL